MPHEAKLAQAQNAFRQVPLGIVGNLGACFITLIVLHGSYTWTQLAPLPIVLVLLQIMPTRLLLGHPGDATHPQWPEFVLKRIMKDSIYLGLYWSIAMFIYLPGADPQRTQFLMVCACFLCAGAAGVLQAVPRSFAAYAGPIIILSCYFSFTARGADHAIMATVVVVENLSVLWMLRINWLNFQELVSRNRTLDALRREAESARQAEATFVENLNHEIRNAVSGVVGYFDIALESNLSEQEQQTLMTNARDASSMLLALLSDLLDVARLNAGRVPLSVQPFDLREVVRLSIVSTSAAIRRRPISVVSAIDSAVPARLMGDAGRVRQIIVNLVSNAIKVMMRGTVIVQATYRFTDGRGWLDLSVIDDGPGISLAQQQIMFERFSRVTELTGPDSRPGVKGWGLGLSISASLVGLMQGSITVRSALGHGAAFSMSLPLAPAETPADPVVRDTHVTTLGRQDVSVLIVDDMPMNLLVLGKMLESLGCRVTLAEHGLDAVRYCSERRFDLVMMDVDMAEMDGVEATRHIRALPGPGATVPIIAVTGFASAEQVARMLNAGMNEHALKPMRKVTAAQLLAKWVPHCASLQDMAPDAFQDGAAEGTAVDAAVVTPRALATTTPATTTPATTTAPATPRSATANASATLAPATTPSAAAPATTTPAATTGTPGYVQ